MSTHPILSHLNSEQFHAASVIEGTTLVVAGPGTGKTNIITTRAAYMVSQNIDPQSILMLTFTNKAANEMKDRVVDKVGIDGHRITVSTFHKFVARYILSPNQHHPFFKSIGFDNGFISLDSDDALKLMKEAINNTSTDLRGFIESRSFTPKKVLSWLSKIRANAFDARSYHHFLLANNPQLKNTWQDVSRLLNVKFNDGGIAANEQSQSLQTLLLHNPKVVDLALCHLWKNYEKQCKIVAGIDYDDMLVLADRLLRADDLIAKQLANQFVYISLDEMQDTNFVQMNIIVSISDHHAISPNLFIVGDPRQSIYGFRSADVTIMTNFKQKYPNTKVVELIKNYRSSQQQIKTNNAHAITMKGQITDGQLIANNMGNEKAQIHAFDYDHEEASFVCDHIQQLLEQKIAPSNIAVLYRSRIIKNEIEKNLANQNINYTVIGDVTFWERKEVKDAVAFLRFCVRPKDVMAASRVLDAIKLGVTGQHLRKNVHQHGNTPSDYLHFIADKRRKSRPLLKDFSERLKTFKPKYFYPLTDDDFYLFMRITLEDWQALKPTLSHDDFLHIDRIRQTINKQLALGAIDCIDGLYYDYALPMLRNESQEKVNKNKLSPDEAIEEFNAKKERVETVFKHMRTLIHENTTINDAVEELCLRIENSEIYDANTIQLMTIHAAKGLEFEHVFIPGLEHENFFRGDEESITDNVDEEGRVFFVAISRDKHCKYLSYAHNRFVNGLSQTHEPLTFIDNILEQCQFVDHRQVYKPESQLRVNQFLANVKSNSVTLNNNALKSPAELDAVQDDIDKNSHLQSCDKQCDLTSMF